MCIVLYKFNKNYVGSNVLALTLELHVLCWIE